VTLIHSERPRTGVAGVRSGGRGESRALPGNSRYCLSRASIAQESESGRSTAENSGLPLQGGKGEQRRAGSPTWRALSLRAV